MQKLKIKTKIMIALCSAALLSVVFALIILIEVNSAREILRALAENPDGNITVSDLHAVHDIMVTTAVIFLTLVPIGCVTAAVLLSRNISKPLKFFADCFSGIADTGNIFLDDEAYKQTKTLNKRSDDIGAISRSVGDLLAMFREKIRWLNAVKDGDLTASVKNRSPKDTVGMAMGSMVKSLNEMFTAIQTASYQVTEGAFKLDSGAKFLADVSAEQAESISKISATVHDASEHTLQKAQMAARAAELSCSIKELAEKSSSQMNEMIDAVVQIKKASSEIEKVIKVIDDIAFQTNILALNAGVEAARAGQHGKGFAVVAQEVRALAAKSQTAAKETSELITASMAKSDIGSQIASRTAASLREIAESVTESSELAVRIAELADSQAAVIAELNKTIETVNETVKQNSYAASESAIDSQEVSKQSALLRESIKRFKIGN